MQQQIVSIYRFANVAGVDREAFLDASQQVGKELMQLDGYQYRSIGLDGDDYWVDIIYWDSAAAAASASEAFMASAAAQHFMTMIDQQSLSTRRIAVAHSSCALEAETA